MHCLTVFICSRWPFQLVNTYNNDKFLHAMTQKTRKEIDSCSDPFGNVRHSCPIIFCLATLAHACFPTVTCLVSFTTSMLFSLFFFCYLPSSFVPPRRPCLRLVTLSVAGVLNWLLISYHWLDGRCLYVACNCMQRFPSQQQAHSLISFMILR